MPQPPTVENTKDNAEGRESAASAAESLSLPTWESFPTRDRQLLVKTIVQTARRQIQARVLSTTTSLTLEARG